jgi:hypothetical protein
MLFARCGRAAPVGQASTRAAPRAMAPISHVCGTGSVRRQRPRVVAAALEQPFVEGRATAFVSELPSLCLLDPLRANALDVAIVSISVFCLGVIGTRTQWQR